MSKKLRKMEELKEIFNHFHNEDLFWLEGNNLIIKCGDKTAESYGEIITLKQILELY